MYIYIYIHTHKHKQTNKQTYTYKYKHMCMYSQSHSYLVVAVPLLEAYWAVADILPQLAHTLPQEAALLSKEIHAKLMQYYAVRR
jgi:hypothetical protein